MVEFARAGSLQSELDLFDGPRPGKSSAVLYCGGSRIVRLDFDSRKGFRARAAAQSSKSEWITRDRALEKLVRSVATRAVLERLGNSAIHCGLRPYEQSLPAGDSMLRFDSRFVWSSAKKRWLESMTAMTRKFAGGFDLSRFPRTGTTLTIDRYGELVIYRESSASALEVLRQELLDCWRAAAVLHCQIERYPVTDSHSRTRIKGLIRQRQQLGLGGRHAGVNLSKHAGVLPVLIISDSLDPMVRAELRSYCEKLRSRFPVQGAAQLAVVEPARLRLLNQAPSHWQEAKAMAAAGPSW